MAKITHFHQRHPQTSECRIPGDADAVDAAADDRQIVFFTGQRLSVSDHEFAAAGRTVSANQRQVETISRLRAL